MLVQTWETVTQADHDWFRDIHRSFNPTGEGPDPADFAIIECSWDDQLHLCILKDLRAARRGDPLLSMETKRAHFWAKHSCVIAYMFRPLPALLRLVNFDTMSDKQILRELGPDFLRKFVTLETWMFCPFLIGFKFKRVSL